jgi:GTP-binding protein
MEVSYITSAQKASQLPVYTVPEVAFMGRSNSGKSSLINALTERKNLARASSTPGRTQMANFFSVNRRLVLADLPGYGYNVARKEIRQLWDDLLEDYIRRPNIKEFLFLIDCRRTIEDFEFEFINNLLKHTKVTVVLTKLDKLKKSEVQARIAEIRVLLEKSAPRFSEIFGISTLKKTGVVELRKRIFGYSGEEQLQVESR